MNSTLKTEPALLAQMVSARRALTPAEAREQRMSFIRGNLPHQMILPTEQIEQFLEQAEGTRSR